MVRGFPVFALLGLAMPAMAAAQPVDGARLFQQRCGACHSLDPAQKKLSSHLKGVVGRAAGSVADVRYSDAMRKSGIIWNAQTMDDYLAAPRKLVPGTTMAISIPDPAQRAAIIAYLKQH